MNIEIAPLFTEAKLNWEEANLYCEMLNYNGVGWRLPSKNELEWMHAQKYLNYTDWYWSSETDIKANTRAIQVCYEDSFSEFKKISDRVRAVRDL